MNNFLQEKIENPKKILVFELFSTRTIKKQLIVSDLDYFRWYCYILKNIIHYGSFKCAPVPVLPTIEIKNNIKNNLENFEQIKEENNELELTQESILTIVKDALLDYNFKNKKQYIHCIESNKVFINLSEEIQ